MACGCSSTAMAERISWNCAVLVAIMLVLSSCESSTNTTHHDFNDVHMLQEKNINNNMKNKTTGILSLEVILFESGMTAWVAKLSLSSFNAAACPASLRLQVEAYHPTKLFVFGDSYVDTGNTRRDAPGSWKEPYGITYPGKPAGRFSDGRVLSDFIAKYLGLKSPQPYELRKMIPNHLKYGMNFAVGGMGVFEFTSPQNMSTQIDSFVQIIKDKVDTTSDLNNSVAYVSVAGNDYAHYLITGLFWTWNL